MISGGKKDDEPAAPGSLPQRPDRSPASRALIVHPKFKDRHPIYHLLNRHYQQTLHLTIAGFQLPFIVKQNYFASDEDLGSVVWSAGIAAAAYIGEYARKVVNDDNWGTMTCLELGCGGAALASQSASLRGFKTTMTDLPHVVEWAKQNVTLNCSDQWNGHPQLKKSIEHSNRDSVAPLLTAKGLCWGEASDIPSETFDYIIAADCLYATHDNPDLLSKLLFTLKQLLVNGRTKLFVSYQLRSGNERTFLSETLPKVLTGYVVEEITRGGGKKDHICVLAWVRPKDSTD